MAPGNPIIGPWCCQATVTVFRKPSTKSSYTLLMHRHNASTSALVAEKYAEVAKGHREVVARKPSASPRNETAYGAVVTAFGEMKTTDSGGDFLFLM